MKILRTLNTLLTGNLTITFDKVNFRYTHLTVRRRVNWLLAELGYLFRVTTPWAWPTHLQIEPSNECNLRCPLCHIVTDNKPRGYLELDGFKKIIDQVGDYLLFLHFWGWGEPFLNKDFYSMIGYAGSKGIQIISSTNGHFFKNTENIDRLIDSGLDVLIVALDGHNAETYEIYRQKGDFDKVVSGIKNLLKRRKERGQSQPRINLRMLVTNDNEDQVEDMKAFAKELGVDIFSLKTICSFDNEKRWQSLLPRNPTYRRFRYDSEGNPVKIQNPCKKPWNHPCVYRDGTIVPCDYHTGEEFNLGNMFQKGNNFKSIWFGSSFQKFRKQFIKQQKNDSRCMTCSLNYADVDRCVSHAFMTGKTVPFFGPENKKPGQKSVPEKTIR